METLIRFVDEKLSPPLMKVAENQYIQAIRDGFVSIMPIITIGSLFLLAAFLPIPAWEAFIKPYQGQLLAAFNVSFSLLALYLSFSLGHSLAKMKGLQPLHQGLMSVTVFLLLAALPENNAIPMANMGGTGIFVALISALFVVEVNALFKRKGIVIRMPAGVPPVIASSFEVMVSLAFIIIVVWAIRVPLKFDVAAWISSLFKPLLVASDSFGAVVLESLLVMLLWFVGIHGHSIAAWNVGILSSFAMANLQANAAAAAAGQALPHVVTPAFRSFFQSGATATIPICLMLIFATRSKQLKQVGRVALIPGIFGVTEPLWFGLPTVLNPFLIVPFILGDLLALGLTYIAMYTHLIGRIFVEVHWAMPGPIGAYLSTGGNVPALLWYLFITALLSALYYPFIRAYDRYLVRQEMEQEAETAQGTTAAKAI